MSSPCDAKKFYDTEFEAELACARTGHRVQAEFLPYRCPLGTHWHIAHKDRTQWGRYRKKNPGYCEPCKQYMRPSRYKKHIQMERHKYLERKMQKEAD